MTNARVLVVEDTVLVADELATNLQEMGYEVRANVRTADEALSAVADFQPDIILMDIILKGDADGIDAAERIHSRLNAPVIYLTSCVDDLTIERAQKTAPFGYLLKPFEAKELHSTIQTALHKHYMETRLAENGRYLQTVINSVAEPIVQISPDRLLTPLNKAALELFSLRLDGRASVQCHKAYNGRNEPCSLAGRECPLDRAREAGSQVTMTHEYLDQNGNIRLVELLASPLFDGQGSFNGIIGSSRDVTERSLAEESLRRERELIGRVICNSVDGIMSLDKDHTVRVWNPAMERMTGVTRERVRGRHMTEVFPFLKDSRFEKIWLETLAGKTVLEESMSYTRSETGRKGSWEGYFSPLRGEAGTLEGGVAIIRDVTERKSAEQKQALLLKELESANQDLTDFAQVVSHDLKSPLSTVELIGKLLQAKYADKVDEEGMDLLHRLQNNISRMNSLIAGILEYSKVGHVRETILEVDVNQLVAEALLMVAVPDNVMVDVQPELPVITCQPTRIRQVFQNLISNAAKSIDKPGGMIRIGCSDQMNFWEFFVQDNGIGIASRDFERIFQMFQTRPLKDSDDHMSTGIGLTLVKKIVELYNGRIRIESTVGQGTTFYFTLPKNSSMSGMPLSGHGGEIGLH